MLVLSRKEDQKVIIPGLDVSIKVIRCKGSAVTLGFEAPPEIRIVRDELDNGISVTDPAVGKHMDQKIDSSPEKLRHKIRNQLNVVSMALQMLLDDIESGSLKDSEDVFDTIYERLKGLKSSVNEDDAFVLVVEDQANERELLAGILRMNGYRVATASDGIEALEYLENNGVPEFIVVDMHLPRCNGVELVQQIRKSPELAGVRVYVVSGSEKEECGLAQDTIDGWYTKPLEPQKLLGAMTMMN